VVPAPRARATASPMVACSAGTITLTGSATRADNLTDSYTYAWTGAGLLANPTGASVTARPTAAATRYYLTVTSATLNGCRDTTSVLVRLAPTPQAAFRVDSASTSATRFLAPITYTFTNNSSIGGGFALDSVRWTYQRVKDGQGRAVTEGEIVFSRQAAARALVLNIGGDYLIRLYTNTTAGGTACPAAVAAAHVQVPSVQTPNIITPNGDNLNETFVVAGEQVGGKLQLFNRWGRLVQQYENYQNEWSAQDQPAGTYYYCLTDRQGQTAKGWVEVVR
jgi:gliding motility-associated-like protein